MRKLDGSYESPVYRSLQCGNQQLSQPRFQRNKFLLAVIEKETPEASKTTLLSLCRTRWVERHEAHEVFFALLPSVLKALEAMSNERLFADQFGETARNWDTDSKSKAN